LSQVFADPLRMRVLAECVIREISPRGFHQEIGGAKLAKIEQAFELLTQYDWLEPVESDEAAPEPDPAMRLYRAIEPPILDEEDWAKMPESTRALTVWRIWETLTQRMKTAMKEGTISGGRTDQHISWKVFELDQEGWDAVIARVNSLFDSLWMEQEKADARMAESGEEPVQMTVGLLAFESPRPGAKKRR